MNYLNTFFLPLLNGSLASFYFVVFSFYWQFMVQRFGVNWSLLFYTGRFILGQQPFAELAIQENKKLKTHDQQFTLTTKKSLHIILNATHHLDSFDF